VDDVVAVLDALAVPTLLVGIDGSIVHANDSSRALFGAVEVGAHLTTVVPVMVTQGGVAELIRQSATVSVGLASPDPHGEPVPLELTFRPLGDDRAVVTVRDLRTERRQRVRLAEREAFLTGIFHNAGVGFLVTDNAGRVVDANDAFRSYVGLTLEEMDGRPAAEMVHPDDRAENSQLLAALGRGALDGYVVQTRWVHANGSVRWGETRSAPLRGEDGTVNRIIVAVTDITARYRANATFRAVFEHSADGYVILDENGVRDCNGAALSLMGLERVGQLTGRQLLSPEFAPEVQPDGVRSQDRASQVLQAAWDDEEPEAFEWMLARSDGSEIAVDVVLARVQLADHAAVLAVLHDLTSRKESEADLVAARDLAERAAKAKTEFLTTMSHEIRTPMNGVLGMLDLLSRTQLTPEQKRMVATTRESGLSLLTILNDILDFSKVEAGKLDLERLPISIHDVIDSVGETLGQTAAKKGTLLQTLVAPTVPESMLGDPVRLRQILFNLVGNAIKFTEVGRVTIMAHAPPARDGQRSLAVRITDTGIGMTEEQVSRLFQPFTQAEASTTRRFGGTGLGLSIVVRLLELMGGTIEVTSTAGQGSQFTIRLPLVEAEGLVGTTRPDLHDVRVTIVTSDLGSIEAVCVKTYLEVVGGECRVLQPSQLLSSLAGDLGSAVPLIFLCTDVDPFEKIRLRAAVAGDRVLSGTRFIAGELPGETATSDLADTVLLRVRPVTRSGLWAATRVALGQASPETATGALPQERSGPQPTEQSAAAAGQLILVAEDNDTNREVLRRQLALLGYYADVVNDGADALDSLARRHYDLLLTDCHMPIVDGYTVAMEVRKREAGGAAHLPIVAITANALPSELQRCLDAGMDERVVKPLDLDDLGVVLQRWIGPAAEVAHPPGIGLPPIAKTIKLESRPQAGAGAITDPKPLGANDGETTPSDVEDRVVLDVTVLEVMLRGDRETARALLADFVPSAQALVEAAQRGLASRDAGALQRVGHTLKSSAAAVGALRLAAACARLEELAADGGAGLPEVVAKVSAALDDVRDAVAKELGDTAVGGSRS